MNYEEAILRLKKCGNTCDDCITCKEHDDAIILAIEALGKQTPKKAINPIDEDGFAIFWNCPNCDIRSTDEDVLYCPNCGQRIDWSDYDD